MLKCFDSKTFPTASHLWDLCSSAIQQRWQKGTAESAKQKREIVTSPFQHQPEGHRTTLLCYVYEKGLTKESFPREQGKVFAELFFRCLQFYFGWRREARWELLKRSGSTEINQTPHITSILHFHHQGGRICQEKHNLTVWHCCR